MKYYTKPDTGSFMELPDEAEAPEGYGEVTAEEYATFEAARQEEISNRRSEGVTERLEAQNELITKLVDLTGMTEQRIRLALGG